MRAAQIIEHVRRQTFLPFRVHLTEGASYEVQHPEMIMVSRNDVVIATYGRSSVALAERLVFCDPARVVRIEQLGARNGVATRRLRR